MSSYVLLAVQVMHVRTGFSEVICMTSCFPSVHRIKVEATYAAVGTNQKFF